MTNAAIRHLPALLAASAVLAGNCAAPESAEAAEETPLEWNRDWPRFRPLEYVVTGIAGPAAVAMYFLLRPQADPHWIGGILVDDDVRDALRLRSPDGLRTVRALADAVGVASVVLVVGVDSMVVPLLRNSTDVAVQLSLMDFESFALSSIVTFSLYDSVGRARPSYVECQHGSTDAQCETSPTASFPSGHVNEVFTAAGLSCAHHSRLPLYGGRLGDALACARDVTLATADGVLRIMGDRHYLTDVLAGAGIGFAFGYGLPTLLHYTNVDRPVSSLSLLPLAGGEVGLVVTGSF
jgi:membrane-associated phospholipid phosphatase